MGRRCCIEGCNSRSSAPEHHGVTYHSYPLDANIRAVWITNTRLPNDRNITKSVLVCSRHFRRADFQPMKSGKYLLKQRVFPTVFPWGKLDYTAAPMDVTSTAPPPIVVQPTLAVLPAVLASPIADATDPATSATVEATIAQIMAETAELNAAAGIKPMPLLEGDTSLQLGKRVITETISEEEPAVKVARTAVEISPVAVAVDSSSGTPGTKFEPVVVFNPGARLEAQDFDGIWHFARVVEVDNDDREVLIKFEKSGKHKSAALGSEEWIPMNSSRLRQKVSTKPIPVFEMEEKVMARWSGPRRFPGTVKKILENDAYEVLFDDGFVKNVRAIHMNKVPTAVAVEVPVAQVVAKQITETPAVTSALSTPATPTNTAADVPIAKTKRTPPAAATHTPTAPKPKRAAPGARKDWPLLQMDKLDLPSLNLPKIPIDGEWTCHWVNDQPIGKEGFLIVGEHRKPTVIVEDWRLPVGWVKHMYQRSNLLGKWDVILVAPNGKRFRSKADLKVYLEEQGIVYNPDIYDFSIHRRRAKDINAYAFTPDYTPQQPKSKPLTSLEDSTTDIPIKTDNMTLNVTPAINTELVSTLGSPSTTSQYIEPPVVTPMPPMELMTTPDTPVQVTTESQVINEVAAAAPTATPAEDGFAYIGGLKVQIVDNLFRCPQEGCFKNFRKENHLQIHVKHYHQDLTKLLGDCPKMQELAEKRTLGTPDANEPQPKNQIPNQQFFAKLHQQDLEQSRAHRRSAGALLAATATTIMTPTIAAATIDAPAVTVIESVAQTQSTDAAKSILAAQIAADEATAEQTEEANNTAESSILDVTTAATDISQTNTTAESSMMELSVVSSTADESNTDVSTSIVLPPKRPRFSPNKRTAGSRKSNRQRTTRRYLTAAQATAGAPHPPPPPVVTADSINNSFGAEDFEETRHSFNATPDAKPADANTASKKRKAPTLTAASATPLSSLDSPVTADSGSSSFLPLPEEPNSVVPIATSQYIKENGELIKIVRMRQEEIINCLCSYGEEDGLMIQCELCLCWQHGFCNGIEKESDVPDKYVCYICRNPQRGRASMRYKHDQDWIYEGKLPVANYHNPNPEHLQRFDLLKKSHTLTGNLVELKRFMHSLRVKINIANNKGHPKMYLWAKKWDDEDIKTAIKAEMQSNQLMGGGHELGTTIKVEDRVSNETEQHEQSSDNKDQTDADADATMSSKEIKTESITPVKAPAPNIPQPEAPIEPVECQHRLLEHIKVQQNRVMERLSKIEMEIDALDKLDNLPDLKNADISTTKDVLSTFIKELEIMKQIAKVNSLENSKQALGANDSSIVIK